MRGVETRVEEVLVSYTLLESPTLRVHGVSGVWSPLKRLQWYYYDGHIRTRPGPE